MLRKSLLITTVIIILLFNSIQVSMNSSQSFQIMVDSAYKESIFAQDVNLTVSINNQYPKWDMELIVNLTVRGIVNELLANSEVSLEIKTVSNINFIANITKTYYLWSPLTGNISLPNGTTEFSIPIVHVPTQQPYIITAIFVNATQTGPNVTFPIYIQSVRTGLISFEGFMVLYFGAIVGTGIIWFLFKTHKIEIKSNETKDLYSEKRSKNL